MNSTRYSFTKNSPIDSVSLLPLFSRLKKDIEETEDNLYYMAGYIANGAVVGMWLTYSSGLLSVGPGTISFDGYTTPFTDSDIEISLSDGDYIVFNDYQITKSVTPVGVVLARYVSGEFDYSVRAANSPLDSVDIVDNIPQAYSSDADYVYVKSSNEMYVTAPFVSDEMLSCIARTMDTTFIPDKKISIARANIVMTDNITVITKIVCNAKIQCSSNIEVSIDIGTGKGDRNILYPDSNGIIYVNLYRDCELYEDSYIRVMVYSDVQFIVDYCDVYAG